MVVVVVEVVVVVTGGSVVDVGGCVVVVGGPVVVVVGGAVVEVVGGSVVVVVAGGSVVVVVGGRVLVVGDGRVEVVGCGSVVVVVGGPAHVPSSAQASAVLKSPSSAPHALPFLHCAADATIDALILPLLFRTQQTAAAGFPQMDAFSHFLMSLRQGFSGMSAVTFASLRVLFTHRL